jgi:hypothetical protein
MTHEKKEAGPCSRCGCGINHPVHAPPYDGREVRIARAIGPESGELHATVHQWETTTSLTDAEQRQVMAGDIVGCLKMWDLTRADADDVLRRARKLARDARSWENPLKGTGLVPVAGTGGMRQQ